MKTKSKTVAIAVSPMLQRLFIVGVLVSYLAQVVQILYWVLQQLPSNKNLSSFLATSVTFLVLPLLFFGLAYKVSSVQNGREARLFSTVLLSVLGMIYVTLVGQVINYTYQYLVTAGSGYWEYILYEWTGHLLALALFGATLYYLKRTKNL